MRFDFRLLAAAALGGLAALLLAAPGAHSQDRRPAAWEHVQIFTYTGGLTGFFDTATGRITLYDANLDQPVMMRQLDDMTAPMRKLRL